MAKRYSASFVCSADNRGHVFVKCDFEWPDRFSLKNDTPKIGAGDRKAMDKGETAPEEGGDRSLTTDILHFQGDLILLRIDRDDT